MFAVSNFQDVSAVPAIVLKRVPPVPPQESPYAAAAGEANLQQAKEREALAAMLALSTPTVSPTTSPSSSRPSSPSRFKSSPLAPSCKKDLTSALLPALSNQEFDNACAMACSMFHNEIIRMTHVVAAVCSGKSRQIVAQVLTSFFSSVFGVDLPPLPDSIMDYPIHPNVLSSVIALVLQHSFSGATLPKWQYCYLYCSKFNCWLEQLQLSEHKSEVPSLFAAAMNGNVHTGPPPTLKLAHDRRDVYG
mmetsp:Transcript_21202/g.29904  ORF Transcript_21202/g.29904 Transcript_21202/m.29904 type:complete len:248 (+) Transcript_21202:63-806(+)|eukprot:CAMPEP_0175110506 /NCGR_PEP_ID=MMETSP0086_2-20121207/14137_1 /TAXON_ID=136419 /ORGANISM="Unknown Unknown, Strain D1" /LENGTH=247 /DNA_ID=CAMNT_0016388649 /DNA_START=66 /DNA_END=809 /DNA_ORIENTATION=+